MDSNVTKTRFYNDLRDVDRLLQLEDILLAESNLPGPRANLTVASVFADGFESSDLSQDVWNLILQWVERGIDDAPKDDPHEFLPFCALQAMGAYFYYAEPSRKEIILGKCQTAMNDARWRMREAAAIALQRIGEREFCVIQSLFDVIYAHATPLEKRAFVASLAHPPLLKEPAHVLYALRLSEQILDEIAGGQVNYKSEEYVILSKGLEYAVSLFVERDPEAGFQLLAKFAVIDNKQIQKIVKSNLGKARISKKFSQQVEQIYQLMKA